MKAALIVMTIMGCDDSATQCHYIDTVQQSWQTVALCDAQAETQINRHQDKNYPVIVAVCESAGDRMPADVAVPEARFDDAAWVGWRLAELLPITLPQRQSLLQEGDPDRRLDGLLRLIA